MFQVSSKITYFLFAAETVKYKPILVVLSVEVFYLYEKLNFHLVVDSNMIIKLLWWRHCSVRRWKIDIQRRKSQIIRFKQKYISEANVKFWTSSTVAINDLTALSHQASWNKMLYLPHGEFLEIEIMSILER